MVKSYWGAEYIGRTGSVRSESFLRLKYKGGGVVQSHLFTGAIAVIRGTATVINKLGKPILPKQMVICRKNNFNGTLRQFRIGIPIEVIDSEDVNPFLVLCRGAESSPVIAKSMCRPVGKCSDTDDTCGTCCNSKK